MNNNLIFFLNSKYIHACLNDKNLVLLLVFYRLQICQRLIPVGG